MIRHVTEEMDNTVGRVVFWCRDRAALSKTAAVLGGLALTATAVAFSIGTGKPNYAPFLPFFFAAIAAATLFGRAAGYLSGAISIGYVWFYILPPPHSLALADRVVIPLLIFVVTVLMSVEAVTWLRSFAERLRSAYLLLQRREAQLSYSLGELQALYDEAPIGLALVDPQLRFIRVNRSLAETNGAPADEHVGKLVWDVVPSLREVAEPYLSRVLRSGEAIDVDLAGETPAQPGVTRHWRETFYPVRSANGELLGVGIFCEEVTKLRQSQERERLLTREVNHRAKNLLSVIQSLVTLTRGNSVAEYRASFLGRVDALARSHDLLSEKQWRGVYLDEVIGAELLPFEGASRVSGTGERVLLSDASAQGISLVLHELSTNSAKYGSLSSGGVVEVKWKASSSADGVQVSLEWLESGGPLVAPPERTGFGTTLVKATSASLRQGVASYDFDPAGLRFHLRFVEPRTERGAHI